MYQRLKSGNGVLQIRDPPQRSIGRHHGRAGSREDEFALRGLQASKERLEFGQRRIYHGLAVSCTAGQIARDCTDISRAAPRLVPHLCHYPARHGPDSRWSRGGALRPFGCVSHLCPCCRWGDATGLTNLATLHQLETMPSKSALNVSLTPELTAFVAAKVGSGRYRSANEVVREALRLLEQQDRRSTTVEVAKLPNGR